MDMVHPNVKHDQPPEGVLSEKKQYSKPAITHELVLETRAGSPLVIDPVNDPAGIFSPGN